MQSLRLRAAVLIFVGIVVAVLGVPRIAWAESAPADVRLALSMDGHIGAWLVAGPFDRPHALDEEAIAPRLDETAGAAPNAPRWRLASSNDDAIDVAGAIDQRFYVAAYAAGVLHLDRGGRHLLLLGAGD